MYILTKLSVLVVEDDTPKLNAIISCLTDEVGVELENIAVARSLTSAIHMLEAQKFALCIVDMSLPTYDFEVDKTGGEPQAKGGLDVLRYIQSETDDTKAVVITQYSEFPDGNGSASTLEQLTDQLLRKFKFNLLAVLFYASQKSEWRSKLKYSINGEFDEESTNS